MKIFITGGLGFVGRHLSLSLVSDGHQVTAVGRRREPGNMIEHPGFAYLSADTTNPGEWQEHLPGSDAVINLAGKSIFTIWTDKAKQAIYDSRILTTRNLVDAIAEDRGTVLVSTSAVGYYGDRGDDVLTEKAPPGDDFLAQLGVDWEQAALAARSKGARVVLPRFGIVLERDGGAMAKMIPSFKMFMGGRLGSGRQWFPWIHLHDLVAAHRFVIDRTDIEGPVNCCAPQPVRNRELTRGLARRLHRPVMPPMPGFAIKALLGEFGKVLLFSQRAVPAILQEKGFGFVYPDIDSALDKIISD